MREAVDLSSNARHRFTPVEAAPQGDISGSGAATVDVVEELPSTDKSPEALSAQDDAG